jgi:peptidoglycan/LPS O-acetylase OafA/YrhL
MPEPVRGDQKYLPGLDGLRALAVTAVVAYHLGYGWAQGGLLGVGVFFTLSGYLITDILLGQWASAGRLRLRDFWLRRARRLLPALFVMLVVVAVWVAAFARWQLPGLAAWSTVRSLADCAIASCQPARRAARASPGRDRACWSHGCARSSSVPRS